MKRVIISFSALLVFCCVCYAQIDTPKKTSNSLVNNNNSVIKTDSISVKVQSDTMNYALLFVYRLRNFNGSLVSYDVNITNSLLKESSIGRIKNDSKFVVKLYQEGNTQISAHMATKRTVNLDVKFGKKYYLKCGITAGALVARPELNIIYPDQGELDFENVGSR